MKKINTGFMSEKFCYHGPTKFSGRQPLKNFTWSILEHILFCINSSHETTSHIILLFRIGGAPILTPANTTSLKVILVYLLLILNKYLSDGVFDMQFFPHNFRGTFICSKSIIKVPKKVWYMFEVNNKDSRTTLLTSLLCFHC